MNIPDNLAKHILKIDPPEPFCVDPKNVKAFILGTDPSNFSDDGKPKKLYTVFGIGTGDERYFSGILANLKNVDLSLESVYVLNLITHYLDFEPSGDKKLWMEFAEIWLPDLKKRLDEVDPERKIPVFATAEILFKFLNPDMKNIKAGDIYRLEDQEIVMTLPGNSDNQLGRIVIPFYRHFSYQLSNPEFAKYTSFIKTLIREYENI